MAKRKKSRKVTRRRARVSGISTGLLPILAVAGGSVAATLIAQKAIPSTVNPKLVGAGLLAGGLLLSKMNNPLAKGLAFGLAAVGGLQLARSFNVVSGLPPLISGTDSIPFRMLAPSHEMSVVGNPQGSPQMNLLNGFIGNPQNMPQMNILAGAELLG